MPKKMRHNTRLLIAHVLIWTSQLQMALLFGATTEFDMMDNWNSEECNKVADRDDISDLRITENRGLPSEMHAELYENPATIQTMDRPFFIQAPISQESSLRQFS
ncbi:uncharacterized protein LY89DRAFT_477771 [Mollisia scopiformis]|uniref:Uncharacterized protein n=1 Tax=Mollisia scopiformis TaxID=149040 RepID=A0A194XG17_MOLSC|nr:uncharacterized protein LY89DRAFT_477771 [Mollisia scopiformis]KUJ19118.1 hypothetical protein LY89DRAFT_477771 [Mollisia scopiformis]